MKRISLALVAVLTSFDSLAATVTSLADDGPGSLRQAIAAGGEIDFAVTGTITITSGELVISTAVNLTGPGADQLTIARSGAAGTPAFRVLKVLSTTATLSGVTISNGLVAGAEYNGAGILNQGSLTLNDCVVRGNRSTVTYARGTGLFNANDATLTANRCVFADNVGEGESAEGSGIYVFGVVNLNDCTIRGNRGEGYYSRGGGLHVDYFGRADVSRCTFNGNSVTGLNAQGGGIYNYGRLEIVNSTLSGNHSGETGGGIHVDALAPSTAIGNCTISGNTARTGGAGLSNYGFSPDSTGPRTVKDSILAGNSPGDLENSGILTSLGHNLFGMVSGQDIAAGPGDHFNVTAGALRLAPLANNGGATQTRGLMAGSLAIDTGNPTSFPPTDQRGSPRPFGARADIGAFELDVLLPALVTVVATQPNTMEAGPTVFVAPGVFTISRSGNTNDSLRVFYQLSGTASNGVDYQFLSNSVVIPAGQKSTELWVVGLFDGLVEGTETVILRLEEPACPPIYPPAPECYLVGEAAEAEVRIQDYEQPANRPPIVEIFAPTDHQTFLTPANIFIAAQANDPDGFDSVLFVEFFANGESIGIRTNLPTLDPIGPFKLTWTNVPSGEYALTAKAVDDQGAATISSPVHVIVHESGSNQLSFRLAFNNPDHTDGVFFQDYTLNGPVGAALLLPADRVVPDSGGRYYYGAKPHQMWRVDSQTGTVQLTGPGPDLPELSWPMGVAFDNHHNRVLLASLGGEGFLYSYSTPSNQWSLVRSLDNRDLDCLEYHASLNALFGVSVSWGGGPAAIYRFSADGAFQGEIPLLGLPFGIGPVGYGSELVSVGDYLVLLLEANPVYDPFGESRIYLIDPRNGDVRLTYQKVRPRPNLPPTVQLNSPNAGQLFSAPAQIQLVAYGQDPEDGYNLTVEFFEGTNSLGFGTFVPSLCPAPHCPNFALTWSNVPPGQYMLTAKARDSAGATGVSSPVQVTVYDPALAIVTVRATDASASESGGTGTFTVSRDGNTNDSLTVFYSLSGAASNGVDYVALSNSVDLPAGVHSATILVVPIDDAQYEGAERVELRLAPPQISPPPYTIVSPSNAVVTISDNEPPPPRPVVSLQATDPLASETAGDPGQFTVFRTGPTNQSLHVFWAISGTASGGVDYVRLTNTVVIPAGSESAAIPVMPMDDHLVEGAETVVATLYYPFLPGPWDSSYVIGSPSNAVVTIQDNEPPGTNLHPQVRIFAPTNGATFTAPANIQICAMASDYVATVEFFAGGTSLGILTNDCHPPECVHVMAPRYCLVWSNVPPGDHLLTAKATDIFGAISMSAPIHISVGPLPDPYQPVVTIEATDAHASEPGVLTVIDPGVFTLYRAGNTSATLHVQYRIEGTASNGLDYTVISNKVIIPAGETSARILINPLHDALPEGTETVTLRLQEPVCIAIYPPPPECYRVGAPGAATVHIADQDAPATNHPPTVQIFTPTDGASFVAPANIFIAAQAQDLDDYMTIQFVEFFADSMSLGIRTNYPTLDPIGPFKLHWTNVPPGEYVLTAKAVDETGAIGISPSVNIRVVATNPPPTNVPIVTIAAPDAIASEGTNCHRWAGWPTPLPANYCGTNTATLVVRRAGPTNMALTVHLRISGTASNGVDYGTLPDTVTIPAGHRAAELSIVPLDDALEENIETVVLELSLPPGATSNTLPYVLGLPSRAAAIIVNDDQPRPVTHVLPDRRFHIMQPAATGTWWRIECSTDLAHWTPLSTNLVTDGALHFVDPEADELRQRFYRALPEPNPPPE